MRIPPSGNDTKAADSTHRRVYARPCYGACAQPSPHGRGSLKRDTFRPAIGGRKRSASANNKAENLAKQTSRPATIRTYGKSDSKSEGQRGNHRGYLCHVRRLRWAFLCGCLRYRRVNRQSEKCSSGRLILYAPGERLKLVAGTRHGLMSLAPGSAGGQTLRCSPPSVLRPKRAVEGLGTDRENLARGSECIFVTMRTNVGECQIGEIVREVLRLLDRTPDLQTGLHVCDGIIDLAERVLGVPEICQCGRFKDRVGDLTCDLQRRSCEGFCFGSFPELQVDKARIDLIGGNRPAFLNLIEELIRAFDRDQGFCEKPEAHKQQRAVRVRRSQPALMSERFVHGDGGVEFAQGHRVVAQPCCRYRQAPARSGFAFPVVEGQMPFERLLRQRVALSIILAQKCRNRRYGQRSCLDCLIAKAGGAFAHQRKVSPRRR